MKSDYCWVTTLALILLCCHETHAATVISNTTQLTQANVLSHTELVLTAHMVTIPSPIRLDGVLNFSIRGCYRPHGKTACEQVTLIAPPGKQGFVSLAMLASVLVTFENMAFTGATARSDSGFFHLQLMKETSQVTFKRCRFHDNTAVHGSVVLLYHGGRVLVDECQVHHNHVPVSLLDNFSAGVFYAIGPTSKLVFTRTVFTDNYFDAATELTVQDAAVVVLFDTQGSFTASAFTNNTSQYGSCVNAYHSIVTMSNMSFVRNENRYAGAVYLDQASQLTGNNLHFEDNFAGLIVDLHLYGQGAGMYLQRSSIATLDNVTAFHNRVNNQGAFLAVRSSSSVEVRSLYAAGCSSRLKGGVLLVEEASLVVYGLRSEFNSGSNGGTAYVGTRGELRVEPFRNGTMSVCYNSTALDDGACVSADGAQSVAINQMLFSRNVAGARAGGVAALNTDSVQIQNCACTDCRAVSQGGCFSLRDSHSVIHNVTAQNCHTETFGGFLGVERGSIALSNLAVTNLSARQAGGINVYQCSSVSFSNVSVTSTSALNGGAFVLQDSTGKLTDILLSGTVAENTAGGIFFVKSVFRVSNLTCNRTEAHVNEACLFVTAKSNVNISGLVMDNCVAAGEGGVSAADASKLNISDAVVVGASGRSCTAFASKRRSSVWMRRVSVSGSTVQDLGVTCATSNSYLQMHGCRFTDNHGGSTVYLKDSVGTFYDAMFTGARAGNGVIQAATSHVSVSRCSFESNEISSNGGSIAAYAGSSVLIDRSSFSHERLRGRHVGAAVMMLYGTQLRVTNSVFVGCSAFRGVIYARFTPSIVIHSNHINDSVLTDAGAVFIDDLPITDSDYSLPNGTLEFHFNIIHNTTSVCSGSAFQARADRRTLAIIATRNRFSDGTVTAAVPFGTDKSTCHVNHGGSAMTLQGVELWSSFNEFRGGVARNGALIHVSNLTVATHRNDVFQDGRAIEGGVFYVHNASVTAFNSKFSGQVADYGGVGLLECPGSLNLIGGTAERISTTVSGGVVFLKGCNDTSGAVVEQLVTRNVTAMYGIVFGSSPRELVCTHPQAPVPVDSFVHTTCRLVDLYSQTITEHYEVLAYYAGTENGKGIEADASFTVDTASGHVEVQARLVGGKRGSYVIGLKVKPPFSTLPVVKIQFDADRCSTPSVFRNNECFAVSTIVDEETSQVVVGAMLVLCIALASFASICYRCRWAKNFMEISYRKFIERSIVFVFPLGSTAIVCTTVVFLVRILSFADAQSVLQSNCDKDFFVALVGLLGLQLAVTCAFALYVWYLHHLLMCPSGYRAVAPLGEVGPGHCRHEGHDHAETAETVWNQILSGDDAAIDATVPNNAHESNCEVLRAYHTLKAATRTVDNSNALGLQLLTRHGDVNAALSYLHGNLRATVANTVNRKAIRQLLGANLPRDDKLPSPCHGVMSILSVSTACPAAYCRLTLSANNAFPLARSRWVDTLNYFKLAADVVHLVLLWCACADCLGYFAVEAFSALLVLCCDIGLRLFVAFAISFHPLAESRSPIAIEMTRSSSSATPVNPSIRIVQPRLFWSHCGHDKPFVVLCVAIVETLYPFLRNFIDFREMRDGILDSKLRVELMETDRLVAIVTDSFYRDSKYARMEVEFFLFLQAHRIYQHGSTEKTLKPVFLADMDALARSGGPLHNLIKANIGETERDVGLRRAGYGKLTQAHAESIMQCVEEICHGLVNAAPLSEDVKALVTEAIPRAWDDIIETTRPDGLRPRDTSVEARRSQRERNSEALKRAKERFAALMPDNRSEEEQKTPDDLYGSGTTTQDGSRDSISLEVVMDDNM